MYNFSISEMVRYALSRGVDITIDVNDIQQEFINVHNSISKYSPRDFKKAIDHLNELIPRANELAEIGNFIFNYTPLEYPAWAEEAAGLLEWINEAGERINKAWEARCNEWKKIKF